MGFMINEEESKYLKTGKGLRQGDPVSPLLFNLVGYVLTRMLIKGAREGLIKGLGSEFREEGSYLYNMLMIPSSSLMLIQTTY